MGACNFSHGLCAANGGAIGVRKATFRTARDRDMCRCFLASSLTWMCVNSLGSGVRKMPLVYLNEYKGIHKRTDILL